MHGRKKPEEAPDEEEVKAMAVKIQKYQALERIAFANRREGSVTLEMLVANGKLLAVNPDYYTLWNHRREMIPRYLETLPDDEAKSKALAGEVELTATALKRNPKSYCAWFQRQWIVDFAKVPLEKELALCAKFLEMDERNFHCWKYRDWVAQRAGVDPADELAFTTEKINQNFSNYSAWHYRSKLLPKLGQTTLPFLEKELELIQKAMFVEPDDQSAWFYHRWLLSMVAKIRDSHTDSEGPESAERRLAATTVLESQLDVCEELWEVEDEKCKWPLVAMAFIKRVLGYEEADIKAHYENLKALDPAHARYYEHAAVTSSATFGRFHAPSEP